MNKQYPPLRPHTFRTLEELERQAQQFAGTDLCLLHIQPAMTA